MKKLLLKILLFKFIFNLILFKAKYFIRYISFALLKFTTIIILMNYNLM